MADDEVSAVEVVKDEYKRRGPINVEDAPIYEFEACKCDLPTSLLDNVDLVQGLYDK